jgi:hypothetical protein
MISNLKSCHGILCVELILSDGNGIWCGIRSSATHPVATSALLGLVLFVFFLHGLKHGIASD